MPHTIVSALLPHLADAAKDARVAAGLTYAHVAVHVTKRNGRAGVSESTVARFEYGNRWPENPDAMLAAYAAALGVEPRELWRSAVDALDLKADGMLVEVKSAKRRSRASTRKS